MESHTFYQSDVDHSESNRGCDIYLTMSLSPIAALVRTNEGPYGRQFLIQFPEMSSSRSDTYAAGTLTGAEICSILYEYALFFTVYTCVLLCTVKMNRDSRYHTNLMM